MKWISVKDRLPKRNQCVLAIDFDHRFSDAKVVYFKNKSRRCPYLWYYKTSRMADFGTMAEFTHWMPLPDPPEEEA